MITLMSTILILTASAANIPSAKAQTKETLVLYTTLGMSAVDANGSALTPGSATANSLNSGDTYTFTATAASGYKFIGWAYADASGAVGSTSASFTKVLAGTCSLQAIYIPTTNTTVAPSGSGSSAIAVFATAGGTTSPAGSLTGQTTTGTVGHSTTFTETALRGYTFLCWVVQCNQNNYYTSSPLQYTPTSTSGAALEAIWVPTGSGITLPSTSSTPTPTPTKVDEFSTAVVAVLALALVAAAFGTYTYRKKRN